jgi:molecular chaperone DnaJ
MHLTKVGRSLTQRQRTILQKYADDVEGRASMPSTSATTPPENAPKATTVEHNNGTASFVQPSPSGGWTRILKRIRGLIGI